MTEGRAIDRFFAAALAPDDWPAALDDIARALGADGATLVIGSSTRQTVAESVEIKSIVTEYFRRGALPDPRENRVQPTLADGFLDDFQHFTARELARDPFYQDFLYPVGFGWHAAACLAERPDAMVLSLKRRRERGPYQKADIEAMDKILPHLRGAAAMAHRVWSVALEDQVAILNMVGHDAILIDRRRRVIELGSSVARSDGLTVTAGLLRASYAEDQADLDVAIGIATANSLPSELPPPPVVRLNRPSGRRPLIVRAMPLDRARRSLLAPAVAIVLITDLDQLPTPGIETARTVFGLTLREAELAARLTAGDTVEQAAKALSITTGHARQRLKIIFGKTDTHRQGELIALLARLAQCNLMP